MDYKMNFKVIVSEQVDIEVEQFWNGLNVWLSNPHVVNRRILATSQILLLKLKHDALEIEKQVGEKIGDFNSDTDFSKILGLSNDSTIGVENQSNFFEDEHAKSYLWVKKLLPRNSNAFCETLDVTIINKELQSVTSFYKELNKTESKKTLGFKKPFRISLVENNLRISVESTGDETESNEKWLKDKLFPRLIKWMENKSSQNNKFCGTSLSLVDSEKYVRLYNDLKSKYGASMVKVWPENTDPLKFVYEDVAIATYLILLWEKEREEKCFTDKQSFLDLGCGNGLLVHILSEEGYPGLGIDLRSRKIWNLFPATTVLQEKAIVPSSSSLFPSTDWIIGNHSDELTPWIPVIAARSSYNCRFFLLPCCAYEFDGRKYQRDNATQSQYSEYLSYIKIVSKRCGFLTKVDKLRIPSTKRICLIGWRRNYEEGETDSREKIIDEVINERTCEEKAAEGNAENWSLNFKPRDVVEPVRNCTKLDRNLVSEIVGMVTTHLLQKIRVVELEDSGKTWNAGGQMELVEVVKLIPGEMLKKLKTECGGLQTLLKNHSHIFYIEDGKVQFRVPGKTIVKQKRKRKSNSNVIRKVKPCWFHHNHPDGCPLAENKCNFCH